MKQIITAMAVTGSIYKTNTFSGKRFAQNVVYTLADGKITGGLVTSRLKRDLPRSIDSKKRCIAAGAMSVEDGMIIEKWVVGPDPTPGQRGMTLVPQA